MTFTASYAGWCEEGHAILPGEEIYRAADGYYRHATCPESPEPDTVAPHEELCPECFLIHPKGACS